MSLEKFGPFASAFENGQLAVPGYLALLNLDGPDTDVVIDRIQSSMRSEDLVRWVDALFDDPNWRAHFVGAIAVLLDGGARLTAAPLWGAIDAGSWVTPQLVVTAYFADPNFPEHLIARLRPPMRDCRSIRFVSLHATFRDRSRRCSASVSEAPVVSTMHWQAPPSIGLIPRASVRGARHC